MDYLCFILGVFFLDGIIGKVTDYQSDPIQLLEFGQQESKFDQLDKNLDNIQFNDESIKYTSSALAPDPNVKGRLLTVAEGCGLSNEPMKRIVGGGPAKNGAWPWMAILLAFYQDRWIIHCAGTLITTKHVLSAAHSVSKPVEHVVRLGDYDLLTNKDGQHVDISIDHVVIHEHYNNISIINDIAIVYLTRDVEFTDRIRPICLPTSKHMRSRSFVGANPFVAGWGTIKEENSIKSHILYQVQVPVIPNDQCEKSFRAISKRVKAAQNYVIDEKYVLCAGLDDGGKDACNGDSGGPLMLPIFANGRFPYFQIGIVSYGEGCARPKIPGVYTNVLQYTDWIIDKLR